MSRARDNQRERLRFWRARKDLIAIFQKTGLPRGWENSIARACREFGLDPAKAEDRDILLAISCDMVLGFRPANVFELPPRPSGGQTKWTPEKKAELKKRARQIRGESAKEVAEELQKQFDEYKILDLATLAKYLREGPSRRKRK